MYLDFNTTHTGIKTVQGPGFLDSPRNVTKKFFDFFFNVFETKKLQFGVKIRERHYDNVSIVTQKNH